MDAKVIQYLAQNSMPTVLVVNIRKTGTKRKTPEVHTEVRPTEKPVALSGVSYTTNKYCMSLFSYTFAVFAQKICSEY